MTPAEFRAHREALGLSQAGLAELWGITGVHPARRISRWETGVTPIDPIAAYAIRLMVEMKGEE